MSSIVYQFAVREEYATAVVSFCSTADNIARYQIDIACMKFINSLSKNHSATLAHEILLAYVCRGTVYLFI